LIQGEFTKAVVGSASGGLNHVIFRECGSEASERFLTSSQYVVNTWLADHGFSVGVEDAIAAFETNN
jgi:DNA-directed RNA polymerase II subunit RPB1